MAVYVRMHRLPNGFKSNEHETLFGDKERKIIKKIHGKKSSRRALWFMDCLLPQFFADSIRWKCVNYFSKTVFFFLSINCTNYFLLPASNVIQIFFFFWRNFHYFALNRLTAFKKWVSFFFVGWLFVYTSRTKKKKLSFLPDFQLINHSNWLLQLQDRNFRSKTICRDLS